MKRSRSLYNSGTLQSCHAYFIYCLVYKVTNSTSLPKYKIVKTTFGPLLSYSHDGFLESPQSLMCLRSLYLGLSFIFHVKNGKI